MEPPEPGPLGMPSGPVGEGLTGAVRRWHDRRQTRRASKLEARFAGQREFGQSRDYNTWRGNIDGGVTGGGG